MGTIDNITFDTTYYPQVVISFTFFFCLFKYVSPSLSAKLFPGFKNLSQTKQIDWCSRVNSSVHAGLVSCMCAYAIVYEEELSEDPIWHNSPLVRNSCAVVVGYMTADMVLMVIYYKQIGDLFFVFHHGASVYAYVYVMTFGCLQWCANYRLMAEFSTPLVNNRWFLDVTGFDKTGPVYIGNGLTMTALFFVFRIVVMPHYWHKIYMFYGTEKYLRLGNIQFVLVSTCFVLDIINIYWFFKLCKGVHKTLSKLGGGADVSTQNSITKKID